MPTFRNELAGQDASAVAGMFTEPARDVIAVLPPAAADKLRSLRQRVADARAITPDFEVVRLAREDKLAAARHLEKLLQHPHDGGYGLDPGDARCVAAEKKLKEATDAADRQTAMQSRRQAATRVVNAALHAVEVFLRDGRPGGTMLQDIEPPPLKDEPNVAEAVELRRRRVRELRAELHRIDSAPYPSDFAKQRAREQIEVLAMRGAASVSRVVEHNGVIEWPQVQLRAMVHNVDAPGAVAITEVPDVLGLFAWLHRETLIKKLDAEITAEADDDAALDPLERQTREAEVLGDLLSIEREEAELVWLAQGAGMAIEHRADCSPLAILQVALFNSPPSQRGTSPEHAYNIRGPRR